MSAEVVRAAGGVVVSKARDGQVRLVIVHRPQYDDWTLPKGKCEPSESWEQCALREVEEETSLRCDLGAASGSTFYLDAKGRPKEVRWWLMRPRGGELRGQTEVDVARWVTPAGALELLTFERDRELVESVMKETQLWVVRHADAGDRAGWDGRDQLRPLNEHGREQANLIAELLRDEKIDRIASSPYLRCVQTLEPLATAAGRKVERVLELAEGHGLDGVEPLLTGGSGAVACTHGDVIDALIGRLRGEGLAGAAATAAKGSIWKLRARAGLIEAAEYIPPPA